MSTTDDSPTPNRSGSFALFHDTAHELAGRLDVAVKSGKLGPLESVRAARLAMELYTHAHKFAAWPHKTAEEIAAERGWRTKRLAKLQVLAREFLP